MTDTRPRYKTWVDTKWRPVAAWTYLLICIFDFVVSPIIFSWFQFATNQVIAQWMPLTLQGSGLFHISFGAIVGITAWGRTLEKTRILEKEQSYYEDGR